MDPITAAILAAAGVGVTSGVTDVVTQAMVDTYGALKGKLKEKFGGDSKIIQAVATLEDEPDFKPNQEALAGRVEQAQAAQDADLQQLAQALLKALEGTAGGKQVLGKYQIDARGAQIGIIGDHAKIEGGLSFGAPKKEQ